MNNYMLEKTRDESKLSFRKQWSYIKHVKRLTDDRYGWLSHLAQFCSVGLTGMMVDLSMYSFLLKITAALSFSLYLSRATAIVTAMTWNFWVNRRLTFSYSRYGNPIKQYIRFVATCSAGGAINWCVAVGLVRFVPIFSQRVLISAVVGIAAGTLLNFSMSLHWVFARPNAASKQAGSKGL